MKVEAIKYMIWYDDDEAQASVDSSVKEKELKHQSILLLIVYCIISVYFITL